ncbi:serine/threonine protein kinase [Saprolegnia parasitica CBS 223.65]|uniref:Serine/threonine protein kinase n=1 Tax=Saprolegnia parasitica (strain CBS 223.65) TaxID=695850 RepID=A0A067CSQ2_SAPPC|nr:serine/threonine protein kinase [Saprolegnia parasitica CBS 223.65]KDO29827.1 serine/threonine protein kinase [Saprolegnia parasitica CBS 223.65]|eukprot:XP_012199533.1 serine/threonine protein kinase [Saprolegnia parasitica CBS 223.65]
MTKANYFVEGVIAKALYGQVLLCRNETGGRAAVKRVDLSISGTRPSDLDLDDLDDEIRDEIQAEKHVNLVLQRHRHRHLVAMDDHFELDGFQHFVFEYCANGELFDALKHAKGGRFCELRALHYFRQIVAGVHHMHRHGFAHRDLSLENVLLTKDNVCKVCDFGLAVPLPGVATETVGKLNYMAPEVHAGDVYDPALADVWSLGMMLFIMISGVPLVDVPSDSDRRFTILREYGVEAIVGMWHMEHLFSHAILDLLQSMLMVHPGKRATMTQVKRYLDTMDRPEVPPPPPMQSRGKAKKPKKAATKTKIVGGGKWRSLFQRWF